MTLPGAVGHPPAKSEVEAQNQIVQLLFQLNANLSNLRVELHNINGHLQTIAMKTGTGR